MKRILFVFLIAFSSNSMAATATFTPTSTVTNTVTATPTKINTPVLRTGLTGVVKAGSAAKIVTGQITLNALGLIEASDMFGGGNCFLGPGAGVTNSTTTCDTYVGFGAGGQSYGGYLGTFVGYMAGNQNTATAIGNTFLGAKCGAIAKTEAESTFVGCHVGEFADGGEWNLWAGLAAGSGNASVTSTGSYSVILGPASATAGFLGFSDVLIGYQACGNGVVSANNIVVIGAGSGINLTSASNTSVVGSNAFREITTEQNNVGLGFGVGQSSKISESSLIGTSSGTNFLGGDYITTLGYGANASAAVTAHYRTAIGANSVCDTDNTITLGRSSDYLQKTGVPVYANNAAATTGGLVVGMFYRTGSDPDVVCIVH